jgi:hypothetical protein
MNSLSPCTFLALVFSIAANASAQSELCGSETPCGEVVYPVYQREPAQPSWIFSRSTYTHDPLTGARVAQYMRTPPVEPLDDPRLITSRYRRIRTNLRGTDGSLDSTYEVQNWGNGRGGLDAEWERFHDAWKESELTGGFYNQSPVFQHPGFGGGFPNWGFGGGFPNGGHAFPNNGFGGPMPGHGFPHGQGFPKSNGMPSHGGPWGANGPHSGNHGGGHHGNGPNGGNHDGQHGHDNQED